MTTKASLTWEVEQHGDATLGRARNNDTRTLDQGWCVTVWEGVAEATRAMLVRAGDVGCRRMTGYVFCEACRGTVACSGVPANPGGWNVHAFNHHACPSCAEVAQQTGQLLRRHADEPTDALAREADAALTLWCRRLLHAGGLRRVELRGTNELRVFGEAGDVWSASVRDGDAEVSAVHEAPPEAHWREPHGLLDAVVRRFVADLLDVRVPSGVQPQVVAFLGRIAPPGAVRWWDAAGGPFQAP